MSVICALLLACGGQNGERATDASPLSPVSTPMQRVDVVEALRQADVSVTEGGEIAQPFFDAPGQQIQINGTELQVFEYPTVAARENDSSKIAPDGYSIGGTQVLWAAQPNFWAEGRVIVLYLGSDPQVIRLLRENLGEPITSPPDQPAAVMAAQRHLADALGIQRQEITVESFEHVQWRNGCLELAEPDEMCIQVITPGWRIVLNAQGEQYVLHTNETGTQIRAQGGLTE
jgi:hypothetical protein